MVRLIEEATRHGNDPELFAGLVHECRYCGLFDQSIAAHHEARRLDPNVPTSAEQTVMMAGDLERLLAMDIERVVGGGDQGIKAIALGLAGQRDRARALVLEMTSGSGIQTWKTWKIYLLAWLDYRLDDMRAAYASMSGVKVMDDPKRSSRWDGCSAMSEISKRASSNCNAPSARGTTSRRPSPGRERSTAHAMNTRSARW
jgi:hypothetical protein